MSGTSLLDEATLISKGGMVKGSEITS